MTATTNILNQLTSRNPSQRQAAAKSLKTGKYNNDGFIALIKPLTLDQKKQLLELAEINLATGGKRDWSQLIEIVKTA